MPVCSHSDYGLVEVYHLVDPQKGTPYQDPAIGGDEPISAPIAGVSHTHNRLIESQEPVDPRKGAS